MGLFDFFRSKPKSILEILRASSEFQETKELFDGMSVMCEDGVDADEMPNGIGEYGFVSTNPIPCKTAFGSTAYLGCLRAADGAKVVYNRLGSTQSAISPHPIDIYEVALSTGRKLATLYISPYQKRISRKPPRGFGLADNPLAEVVPLKEIVTEPDGTVKYYSYGVLHREDGPAVIEIYSDYDGQERHHSWYRYGVRDRDDGPAVIGGHTTNGQYEWWRAGALHRDKGPAVIELIDSLEFGRGPVYEWWKHGDRHKVQDGDGIIYYYKEGKNVLTELPNGHRIIDHDDEYRLEDSDGNDLDLLPVMPPFMERVCSGYAPQWGVLQTPSV